jgi:transmembrane sensor
MVVLLVYSHFVKEEKYWVLLAKKLSGEASDAELEELRSIIASHPEWTAHSENLQEFWAADPVESPKQRQKAEDAYLAHVNRLKEQVTDFEQPTYPNDLPDTFPRSRRKWRAYALATAAIATVTILLVWLNPFTSGGNGNIPATALSPANEISISQGSRTKIVLPDGSSVWVNSGSKLTYDRSFNANTREVELDGEAYFDVVKDASRPFVVHTAGIDIKVLGTAFNVRAYKVDPTIEATLIHGAIEVTDKTKPGTPKIMLKPREKLVFNKALANRVATTAARQEQEMATGTSPITIRPLAKRPTDTTIVETAWVYNKLVFEDERFADLAVRMERWYNIKITIASDKLKDFRISGSFVNETAEEAVQVLQLLVPFSYSIHQNEIKIMRK